jgi:hypothetical protein
MIPSIPFPDPPTTLELAADRVLLTLSKLVLLVLVECESKNDYIALLMKLSETAQRVLMGVIQVRKN